MSGEIHAFLGLQYKRMRADGQRMYKSDHLGSKIPASAVGIDDKR